MASIVVGLAAWRELFPEPVDDTGDTLFDQCDIEIDQQPGKLLRMHSSRAIALCCG
jgi:hypothetical protein